MRKKGLDSTREFPSSSTAIGFRSGKQPGSVPGIENSADRNVPPAPGEIGISCLDLGEDRCETQHPDDLDAFLRQPRPAWSRVRWIDVDQLHPFVVSRFMEEFGFHTLSAEDVLTPRQRPKLEIHDDHLFIIARMLSVDEGRLINEQVSFFLFGDLLLTFQEVPGDVWEPVRKRLLRPGGRFRQFGAPYLLYALLDAIVDHLYPVLEIFGDELQELEEEIIGHPSARVQHQIHSIKRDLFVLRSVIWPMRDMLNQLHRDECDLISSDVEMYFRDVQDHAVQVIDVVESLREIAGGLNELFMSSVGNRMNEIMKVLTIIATFFIPLTFLAGVYGMNFEHMPELKWKLSYPVFWAICIAVTGFLAVYFYRKGWIGGGN